MFKVGDTVIIANPLDGCVRYTTKEMEGWSGVINNIVIDTCDEYGEGRPEIYITLHNPPECCMDCVIDTCYWDEIELLKVIEMNRNGANE